MKRFSVTFTIMFLIVELATSWSVWSNQPSHGLDDVYEFSFINYETERLLSWSIITAIVVGLFWLASKFYRAK